jgi:hypothetical protein
MVRPLATGFLLAALAATPGCQGQPPFQFAPVEGTVTRGGKPLAGVIVVLWPDAGAGTVGPCSSGPTDAAGHYQLHTEQGDTGALVGRHRVCIVDGKVMLGHLVRDFDRSRLPKDLPVPSTPKVPPGYASREETPLRAEVRPGEPVIDLEVK